MFDRSLVTSRFDTETLISETYLRYLLLAQIEAGLLLPEFDVDDPGPPPTTYSVQLHPPADENYQRLYKHSEDPPLPPAAPFSFDCRLLPGEASAFCDLAFAPDGSHLLTRSVDDMVRIWDLDDRTQDEGAAFGVNPAIGSAFNVQGTQLATASTDQTVRVWDLQAKWVVMTLSGHTEAVESVAFSPDGQRLVSGSFDQSLRVWDLQTGTVVHTLTGHVGRVISVAFNHTGTQIVSGGEDGTVRVWDMQSGAPLQVLEGHTGPVNCAVFSPDDLRIASGSDDRTVLLWDPGAGTIVRRFDAEHKDAVLCVDIGDNGTLILSGSKDNTLKLWSSTRTKSLDTSSEHRSAVTRARFAGASARHASVSAGGSIRDGEVVLGDPKKKPLETIELRMDFMQLRVFTTVVTHTVPPVTDHKFMGLIVYLALYAETSNGTRGQSQIAGNVRKIGRDNEGRARRQSEGRRKGDAQADRPRSPARHRARPKSPADPNEEVLRSRSF